MPPPSLDRLLGQTSRAPLARASARAFDNAAQSTLHIPGALLMENAGRESAIEAERLAAERGCRRVLVVAGLGNNGGDGFVAARHLAGTLDVKIVIAGDPARISGDARANLDRAAACGVPVEGLRSAGAVLGDLGPGVLVVDAIFGTGLDRPVEGLVKELIETLNASGAPVLAVDVPSGLDADTGEVLGAAVRAARTIAFVASRPGFVRGQGPTHAGDVVVRGIGVPFLLTSKAPASRDTPP
jgi:NAD(P)H-hydrate epimerase